MTQDEANAIKAILDAGEVDALSKIGALIASAPPPPDPVVGLTPDQKAAVSNVITQLQALIA